MYVFLILAFFETFWLQKPARFCLDNENASSSVNEYYEKISVSAFENVTVTDARRSVRKILDQILPSFADAILQWKEKGLFYIVL